MNGSGTMKTGLKSSLEAVAIFEASKGILVLVVGVGLLALIQNNAQTAGEDIVRFFHLNPAHRYPKIFHDAVLQASNPRLWLLSLSAIIYSMVRFVEAYGLWNNRQWAEWFAVLSGGLYVPVEIYEIINRITVPRIIIAALNIIIVSYLLYVLRGNKIKPLPK